MPWWTRAGPLRPRGTLHRHAAAGATAAAPAPGAGSDEKDFYDLPLLHRHPRVGNRLARRLHRRLARALIQLFLAALRNLSAFDFRARRARDSDFDDLPRAACADRFRVEREHAVRIRERVAVGSGPIH